MDKAKKLYICAPDGEFLRPYIEREIPDCELVDMPDGADYTCAIIGLDTPAPADCAMVLRCPYIVGTGMTGMPMEFARRIARGTFCHIKGNEARISLIHAVDVAVAVRLALGQSGDYVITDGVSHTIRDFAEALAWRIDQKRIFTLKPRWARWLIGRQMLQFITSDHLADGSAFAERFNFQPNNVCEYLRTHVYNDESL